jgi:hypothetical protein
VTPEVRSAAFLDSENLFYALGARAAEAYFALLQWCDANMPLPRDHRSYGKAEAPGIAEIEEVARNSGSRIIHVGRGKDIADNRLLRDLGETDAEQYLVASGDLNLLAGANASKHLNWVVIAGGTSIARAIERMPRFPRENIVVFESLFAARMRERRRHHWPKGSVDGVALPRWADLRGDVAFTDPAWEATAFATLRARGFDPSRAEQLSGVLSRWLPVVLPAKHHALDDAEAPERWRWACLAAVAAAAMEPGTSNRHVAVDLFTAYERDRSEHWETAKARGRRVVGELWGDMGDREHILTRRARRR